MPGEYSEYAICEDAEAQVSHLMQVCAGLAASHIPDRGDLRGGAHSFLSRVCGLLERFW